MSPGRPEFWWFQGSVDEQLIAQLKARGWWARPMSESCAAEKLGALHRLRSYRDEVLESDRARNTPGWEKARSVIDHAIAEVSALTTRLAEAEAKSRIDEEQCDRMTETAGRLAQELRAAETRLAEVERERDGWFGVSKQADKARRAAEVRLAELEPEAKRMSQQIDAYDEAEWQSRAESAEQLLSEMAGLVADCLDNPRVAALLERFAEAILDRMRETHAKYDARKAEAR